ncbi:MAG: PPOX class F420-dependent oxidoreductase [bacterium]|nr:PPOX class F420-dependent oxidoreductase [Gammaproteobacteria bacterium]HIL99313.1 PPOX class F420-dependent oxidoreductase [Pseudomonadales bacterium]
MNLPFDLASEPYINLATFRKNGHEVRTPVWVASAGDTHYVFSEARAGKVKRIRNNGRINIAACDARGGVKSTWISGTARIVTDEAEIETMYRVFDQKYGWQMRLLNFTARLSGRYRKRAIIAFQTESSD